MNAAFLHVNDVTLIPCAEEFPFYILYSWFKSITCLRLDCQGLSALPPSDIWLRFQLLRFHLSVQLCTLEVEADVEVELSTAGVYGLRLTVAVDEVSEASHLPQTMT